MINVTFISTHDLSVDDKPVINGEIHGSGKNNNLYTRSRIWK
ncbi:MAG: hypothetical protein ACI936_002719 [Paraglaciecola sp.]|jgi:hypothetical protein